MSFQHIFSPVRLRHRTLRNRIVFGAHTTNMAENGMPGKQHLGYYLERARGGAAMIVVEPMPVHAAAVLTRGNFRHSSDDVIEPFRKITAACKDEGAVMIQQLYHVGAHADWDNSWHAGWSPSGGPSYHDNDGSHEMTVAEIEETIDAFVQAAVRCQKSGFDGVEVWAAYHSLLDQFWTPFSNQRQDEWGGSLENRTRFSREILRRIRVECGEKFIVGLAISDEPDVAAMLDRTETAEIVALHDADHLMDYVTVGTGSYMDFNKIIPSFQYGENLGADLASQIKQVVENALVTTESNIRTPDNANTILGSGGADLVCIVRGQIADPKLVKKAEANRAADIRGCLSCNQQCWGRRGRDYWISCLVNPSVGREYKWSPTLTGNAETVKTVLVVGAGPAGMEASRVAAKRGHRVILAEAGPQLGGQFRLAGLQPRRGQIGDLLGWYERQLGQQGVDIRFNTYLEASDIADISADRVVLATGSMPAETGFQKALAHIPELPGLHHGHVWSVDDVMNGAVRLGDHVIVLDEGGNWRGIGTAWKLAEDGHQVTIVTPDSMVAKDLQRSSTDGPARQTLARLGVKFETENVIVNWGAEGAKLQSLLTARTNIVAADDLVLATGNRANADLSKELVPFEIPPIFLGDALAPRNAAAAIYDGRRFGLNI